jgi:hypothetical protein
MFGALVAVFSLLPVNNNTKIVANSVNYFFGRKSFFFLLKNHQIAKHGSRSKVKYIWFNSFLPFVFF